MGNTNEGPAQPTPAGGAGRGRTAGGDVRGSVTSANHAESPTAGFVSCGDLSSSEEVTKVLEILRDLGTSTAKCAERLAPLPSELAKLLFEVIFKNSPPQQPEVWHLATLIQLSRKWSQQFQSSQLGQKSSIAYSAFLDFYLSMFFTSTKGEEEEEEALFRCLSLSAAASFAIHSALTASDSPKLLEADVDWFRSLAHRLAAEIKSEPEIFEFEDDDEEEKGNQRINLKSRVTLVKKSHRKFFRCLSSYFPILGSSVALILSQRLLPPAPPPSVQSRAPQFPQPGIDPIPAGLMEILNLPLSRSELWALCCSLPLPSCSIPYSTATIESGPSSFPVHTPPCWDLLYDSDDDGKSIARLSNGIVGYPGPTLILVYEATDSKKFNIFGGFTTEEWKSSTSGSFFGSRASTSSSKVSSVSSGSSTVPSTFLFSIRPQFRVCRPTGVGQNFLYYTAASRTGSSIGHTSTGNAPVGIGFGGQLNFFRLFLDEDLRHGVARSSDSTFEKGALREERAGDGGQFEIAKVQIWGIGGEAARTSQEQFQARELHLSMKQRKINVKRMMGVEQDPNSAKGRYADQVDMKILEMAGVHQSYDHEGDHT